MKTRSNARTTSTREVVLGLLAQRPMSGYDIRRLLGGLSWLIGSPSFGALYPGLHTLLAEGLVTVEVIPNESKPARKLYTITDAGRQALREWVSQRTEASGSLRDFVLRLILASNLSEENLTQLLRQRLEQVEAYQPTLNEALGATSDDEDLGKYLALDYGQALADAERAWLARTVARFAQRPVPAVSP